MTMQTDLMTAPTGGRSTVADRARRAATEAAAVLPSVTSLLVGEPTAATAQLLGEYTSGCLAQLPGLQGHLAILVGEELVSVLDSSPLRGLDLASTLQPAIDAAAASFGSNAEAARELALELLVSDLGGPLTVVPLMGTGFAAALLISDTLLAEPAPDPVAPAFISASGVATPAGVTSTSPSRGIEMLHGVDMELTVELGRARMTVRELLALSPGAVLELDRAAGSPADLMVNGRLIARGEVVVVDEDFGLRITEIVDPTAS